MDSAAVCETAETAGSLIVSGAAVLAAAGIATARLDTEVLLAYACGIDRAGLYARWHDGVDARCRARFDAVLTRRQAREPLQYIIGQQEFWSLDFIVTPDVLIPRPETELLIELTLQIFPPAPVRSSLPLGEGQAEGEVRLRMCDLGTGSGCIAVTLAHELPGSEIWALDISDAALAVARLNAASQRVADRIRFIRSDGFSDLDGTCFDAIVSNPPYVSSGELEGAQPELAWEPRQALDGGPTGLAVIERIIAESPGHLNEGGWLLMEIGAEQGAAVERLARAAGFRSVAIRADYAGLPRALVAQR